MASLKLARLAGSVKLRSPSRGLADLQIDGRQVRSAQLFGVHFEDTAKNGPETVTDAFVRSADLIVTYDQSPDRSVRPQVYWHAIAESPWADRGGIELIISLQTALLDSNPATKLVSQVPATEILQLSSPDKGFRRIPLRQSLDPSGRLLDESSVFLFRVPGVDWSYVEMVHPSDCVSSLLQFDSTMNVPRLSHRLFEERLEKGVIRRGRVRGMFLARNSDERLAVECVRQLLSAAPPLTA